MGYTGQRVAGEGSAVATVAGSPLAADGRRPTAVIEATRGWRSLGLHEVWEYRELLYFMVWRDVKGNYRQMAFGPLWIILQPLINMVVLSLIFGQLARLPSEGVPYPIFTYVALLPWQFFATSTRATAQSLVTQRHIIAKVYFPRLIIPLSAVAAAFVDFVASSVVLCGLLAVFGIVPGWQVVFLPLFLLLAAATALGVGLCLAGLAVKYRDVALGLGFAITMWQYLTPVAYSSTLVPERWQVLYRLNPMAGVVEGFRWAILGIGQPPGWPTAAAAIVVLGVLAAGLAYFRHSERTIVDVL